MAGELRTSYLTGNTVYVRLLNPAGQFYNTSSLAFETYQAANYASYAISTTEAGATGTYIGDFPSGQPASVYTAQFAIRAGATVDDGDLVFDEKDINWTGSSIPVPSLQIVATETLPSGSTMRDYYEWMRIRLGILTPKDAGIEGAAAGDEPDWQKNPSNYQMASHIRTACQLVNQHVGLADAGQYRDLPVAAQTADGPLMVELGTVAGFDSRGINSIRRAWWYDGSTSQRLDPVSLAVLDMQGDPWRNDTPGTPRRFAIEGYKLYIDPPPSDAGYFRYMASCGVLAPNSDMDCFDQIPSDYDPCILYIALVELGKSRTADTEMAQRAQVFAPDAAAGLERLAAWFHGGSNEQEPPQIAVDFRWMRRRTSRR